MPPLSSVTSRLIGAVALQPLLEVVDHMGEPPLARLVVELLRARVAEARAGSATPRSPPSASRGRCRDRAPCAPARSGPRGSCPRCRARRSRPAPGSRENPRASARYRPRPRSGRTSIQSRAHLHPVGDAAVGQRLGDRLVGVLELGVLADDRHLHLAFGDCGCGRPRPPISPGSAAAPARSGRRRAPPGRAPRRGRRAAPRRSSADPAPRSPHRGARCRRAPACRAPWAGSASPSGRPARPGAMPMARSSLTECCVGLVFSSPEAAM